MTAAVEIDRVSHRYDSFAALVDINLKIEAGSFTVLLGPSGCGKTTLLSVLGGFIKPTSGSVLLNGVDVTDVPPAKRATTTMFQDYALFPHMNLLDNVGFGLRMRGHSKKQRSARSLELLQLVALDASAKKKPHELSGGQKQRVALARALAVEPDVLLLDEPLGALDLKLRRQMQSELKAIQNRVGTTFVHVTHDQEEAMAIADQIIVMNAGAIEDHGTPESIYLNPRSLFSAAFMGEANLIDGQVRSMDESGVRVSCPYGDIVLSAHAVGNVTVKTGDSVLLCFRPEHISLYDKDSGAIDLGLVKIVEHAFFGSYQRCRVTVQSGQVFTVHLPQSANVAVGRELPLGVDASSIILLCKE